MRIAVIGAGGVGGYFGGLLQKSGQDVAFLARGEHLRALRERGLRVRSVHGDFELPSVRATDRPEKLGQADLVLFTVKTYDTESAAAQIRPAVGPNTAVLTFQNGVDNPERIDRVLGAGTAMGGTVHIETTIAEPGVIAQTSPMRRVALGELNGRPSERAERARDAFQSAGLEATLSDNIRKALWEKFLFIVGMSGLSTLTRSPVGVVLAVPEVREMLAQAFGETAAVAEAEGVALDPDPVGRMMAFAQNLKPGMKSSMQRDLERGRRLEVESINGTVVRLGRAHGIPTPVNACIYACLTLEDLRAQGALSFET
jgi:2-dehydropantoate 2-reductase